MKTHYFGTDGIRGTVGDAVMKPDFARRVGHALAAFLQKHNPSKPITVVIGRDTRESGVELQGAIVEGFCAAGQHVIHLGVIPTPGVALALRQLHADLGIVITASHNPATDNGIKLFDNRGHKYPVETEVEIEALIDATKIAPASADTCGFDYDGRDHYVEFIRSQLHQDCICGWKVVLDCANGATATVAPEIFGRFGAECVVIGDTPDGRNINDGVGSEYPAQLAEAVKANGANVGFGFDGDGDRVIVCDETGQIVDGDELLGLLALERMRRGELKDNTLVVTIMSNLGLDRALEDAGGRVERVGVGDRNVLHRLIHGDYSMGGEQSGHIIFAGSLEAGDGILAAVRVLDTMLTTHRPVSELRREIPLFGQLKKNLRVRERKPLSECENLAKTVAAIEDEFAGQGRLLIRYSGTEPKIRLLVESRDEAVLQSAMDRIIAAAEQDLEVAG